MNENSPNPNLNESDLLELALRLTTYPNDPHTQNAQLLPGQLPEKLLVEIPIPEGSRVLGSLIRNPESIEMLLDTYLPHKTQLEQSGCVLTEEGQDGPLAWFAWTVKEGDKQCHGFFMVLKELNQEYYLHLRMKSPDGGQYIN